MLARLSRVILSFAITLSAYWLYAAIAVPLIEPQAVEARNGGGPVVPPALPALDRQRELLAHWFRPGDWELDEPKVLETPQGMLLINHFKVLDDQVRVELWPCTMVFLPDENSGPPEDRYRRAVIMRSSPDRGKAVLHFDGPVDLTRGKIGKLIGGRIIGNVTIYSQQRSPGPEDDLQIHARDLELRDNRATSPNVVDLRWGLNTAQGQRLKIDLSGDDKSRGFRGVLSVELQQQVHVRLESIDKGIIPGGGAPPSTASAAQPPSPVEISSRGPFRFDFTEYTATFQDHVDVVRVGAKGASEQLTCELLSIYFRKPAKDDTPTVTFRKTSLADAPKFEPQRVVAFGQPVTVRMPAEEMLARAGQIEYEVSTGGVTLRDGQEVALFQGRREIHCRELYAEPDQSRRLGLFLAKGEGWLKGATPDDQNQSFQASWTRRLHFRPHEKQHVLSLEGDAHVDVEGKGKIDAEEVHLWLDEKRSPSPSGEPVKVELSPDRLTSVGKVNIESAQITGTVNQLQVWFESPMATPLSALVPRHILAQLAMPIAAPPVTAIAPSTQPEAIGSAALPPNRRMHVEGELMRIRARPRDRQFDLSEVIIEHDVRVRETATDRRDEQPLLITGKKLHLVQQTANETIVTVSGQPAHIEGRGMTLDSSAIHLNRLTGAVWTDGAGQMTMLVDRDPDGRLLAQPQRLEVTWQEKLEFNGRTAHFRRGVIARQAQELVRTQLLEVVLSSPVNLNGGAQPRPEVEHIHCREGVFLEHPAFDGNRLISLDRLQAVELSVHRPSGQLTALGPGWVKSVRLETGPAKSALPGQKPAAPPVNPPAPGAERLTFVGVEYQGSLSGNLIRRDMTFESAVRTIYGPVQHWEGSLDPDKPQQWNANGLLMTSDRLAIVQLPGATPEQRTHEMEATGNTVVEGATYTARAGRITYSQAKEMLVVEGSSRSDADLSYQPRIGGTTSKVNARKILFWPSANRVEVDDARFLDLNGIK